MKIGINSSTGQVFEGGVGSPRLLEPKPFLTSATIGDSCDLNLRDGLPKSPHFFEWKMVFREDFFDPNGRTRRGRFYKNRGSSHELWHLGAEKRISTPLNTFEGLTLEDFNSADVPGIRIFLGTFELNSAWKVTLVEFVNSAELLFTLKSTSMLGILPDIQLGAVPEKHRGTVSSFVEKLADEVKRGTPESIVDISRNLASALLTAVNQEFKSEKIPEDLAGEANFLERECTARGLVSWYTIAHCSRVIARLHAEARLPGESRPF